MVRGLTAICCVVFTKFNRLTAVTSVPPRFTSGCTAALISLQSHHTTIPNMTQRSFYPFRFKIWTANIAMYQRCHFSFWGSSNSWGLGNCHWEGCNTFSFLISLPAKNILSKILNSCFCPFVTSCVCTKRA